MGMNNELLDVLSPEYEIVGELGHGGASVVYLARDRELEREVAIKVIDDGHAGDPEARARFQREARMLARLQHPNIVQLYQAKRLSDGRLALVMQHMTGRSLREVLLQDGALPWARAQAIMGDIGRALVFLHQRGIVHRDVKPENIYIDPENGRALLGDFGIAKQTDGLAGVTVTGAVIGTPAYMSPEQVDGHVLDGRSDLYSLGLVAHEMLSGLRPWAGEGIYAIIYKQKHEELPSLDTIRAEVPPHLRRVIEKALAKDRDARWSSAEELLAELDAGVVAPPRARIEPPSAPVLVTAGVEGEPALAAVWREIEGIQAAEAPRPARMRRARTWGPPIAAVALLGVVALAYALPGADEAGRTEAPGTADGAEWATSPAGITETAGSSLLAAGTDPPSDPAPETELAATDSATVAAPEAADASSNWLVRELSSRIAELERQLTARPPRTEVPSTPAPAPVAPAVESPEETPPTIAARVVQRSSAPATEGEVRLAADGVGISSVDVPPRLANRALIRSMLDQAVSNGSVRGRTEGPTVLRALVDTNGRVVSLSTVRSSGNPMADQAVERTGAQMRFTPAVDGGVAVPMWIDIPLQINTD